MAEDGLPCPGSVEGVSSVASHEPSLLASLRRGGKPRLGSFHRSLEVANRERRRGCPLSLIISLAPGFLICLVGFLAWGIPFQRLVAALQLLAQAFRAELLQGLASDLQLTWDHTHVQILQEIMWWRRLNGTSDAFAESMAIGRHFQATLITRPETLYAGIVTVDGACVHIAALLNHPQDGFLMEQQNCTHRWLEGWNVTSLTLTGEWVQSLPYLNAVAAGLGAPVNQTTAAEPFTWMGFVEPDSGVGRMLEASGSLFDPGGRLRGRVVLGVAVDIAPAQLQGQLGQQASTAGGRMVVYEAAGDVIASTQGQEGGTSQVATIDDSDLQRAVAFLNSSHSDICVATSAEVDLSVPYFLDVQPLQYTGASPYALRWCILLLVPQANVMAEVEESLSFALIFVCCVTLGVTGISVVAGFFVSRPLRGLADGMVSLKRYDVALARASRSTCSVFAELYVAQASLHALVDAIEAFGKYVPQNVVQGLLARIVHPQLGMEEKLLAVAFMDMQNFTTMCESVEAQEIVAVSCQLFDVCCEFIHQSKGLVDKFMGDCIMALWGAPASVSHPGRHGLDACAHVLTFLTDHPLTLCTGMRIAVRIGLHAGRCLVGNFGASSRWDYTAVGDVVNSASRLETLNKQCKSMCLTTEAVVEQLYPSDVLHKRLRPVGNFQLGKKEPMAVHEMLARPMDNTKEWETAMAMLAKGYTEPALRYFRSMPDDPVAAALVEEVGRAPVSPGAGPWMRTMTSK